MVDKTSEWAETFNGTLEGVQDAAAALRQAGAPGESDVEISGSGLYRTLAARFYYYREEDDEEATPASPVEAAAR